MSKRFRVLSLVSLFVVLLGGAAFISYTIYQNNQAAQTSSAGQCRTPTGCNADDDECMRLPICTDSGGNQLCDGANGTRVPCNPNNGGGGNDSGQDFAGRDAFNNFCTAGYACTCNCSGGGTVNEGSGVTGCYQNCTRTPVATNSCVDWYNSVTPPNNCSQIDALINGQWCYRFDFSGCGGTPSTNPPAVVTPTPTPTPTPAPSTQCSVCTGTLQDGNTCSTSTSVSGVCSSGSVQCDSDASTALPDCASACLSTVGGFCPTPNANMCLSATLTGSPLAGLSSTVNIVGRSTEASTSAIMQVYNKNHVINGIAQAVCIRPDDGITGNNTQFSAGCPAGTVALNYNVDSPTPVTTFSKTFSGNQLFVIDRNNNDQQVSSIQVNVRYLVPGGAINQYSNTIADNGTACVVYAQLADTPTVTPTPLVTATPAPQGDLRITKTGTPVCASDGSVTIAYLISVSNVGTTAVSYDSVIDRFPGTLTSESQTTVSPTATVATSAGSTVITWPAGSVGVGSTTQFSFTARLDKAAVEALPAGKNLENKAEVNYAGNDKQEAVTSNASAICLPATGMKENIMYFTAALLFLFAVIAYRRGFGASLFANLFNGVAEILPTSNRKQKKFESAVLDRKSRDEQ